MQSLPALPPVIASRSVPATVYSLSCENDWPEQAACIRSFLRFVGKPERFVVVSDGSHDEATRRQLEQISPCVSIQHIDSMINPGLSPRIRKYAAEHFLGKKLSLFVSMQVKGPTIYTDSDVLFFPGASALTQLLNAPPTTPLYLLDCFPSLDDRLLRASQEKESPVNGGFVILNRNLDWTDALSRLEQMQGECVFFTEQTLVHLAVKANSGKPLPAEQFVLRAEDQFLLGDRYARDGIALRHYISSIRTKFWHHTNLFC